MTVEAEPEAKPEYDADGNEVLWVLKDPGHNLKDAVGLLKDWVSTLLTLQTSLIAAVAALVGFRGPENFQHFTNVEFLVAGLAALSALISIVSGLLLLNMLPAAVQRQPSETLKKHPKDLYYITTQRREHWKPATGRTILCWTQWFRASFIAMVVFMVLFVGLRLWPALTLR